MDAGMLEVRQRWNGECFIQATAALEPVPGVTQSTQLRQEKRQPSSSNYLEELLTRALERFGIILVIKQH